MKKIIFAAMTAMTMFAFSNVAEAARGQNTQYSKQEEVTFNPIESIFGGSNWTVTPQFRVHPKHAVHSNSRYHTYTHNYSGTMSRSIVSYGHMLQNMGIRVSEHPAFGGVHHVHHGWAHYAGRAIDINVGRGVVEARSAYAGKFDRIAASARRAGYTVLWRVAGHYNHMHIQR